jgi:ATP-dependent Lon protease
MDDLDELPEDVRGDMQFVSVNRLSEVLTAAVGEAQSASAALS